MIEIGFHTDAFNSSYWNFEQCLQWAQKNDVHWIECGMIDGVSWIHGLGYQPHVAMWEDPMMWREKIAKYGVRFSQIDAAFPLSLPEGATLGVEYALRTIRWAYIVGCDHIDTTDDRFAPKGLTDAVALDMMKRAYAQIRSHIVSRRSQSIHHVKSLTFVRELVEDANQRMAQKEMSVT